ncbi:MAG: tRNA pseudouridine synthase A [Phycisphaeraceae bacterium]|nr:tRNA pseudouridine synthase A [Phycisphaeraceae bacterium]
MPRYKLTIAYDGTEFCGWQKQFPHADAVPAHMHGFRAGDPVAWETEAGVEEHPPAAAPTTPPAEAVDDPRVRRELRTVQSVVERAVRLVVREPVVVTGASRTDAGVHARGQVAAFSTLETERGRGWPAERGTLPLMRAVNARLPDDVLVRSIEIVPEDFNPIAGAAAKGYTYSLWCADHRPMWSRRTVMHLWHRMDVGAMRACAAEFVGEHDFAAFAATGHGRLTTVRTVFGCEVIEESAGSSGHGSEEAEQRGWPRAEGLTGEARGDVQRLEIRVWGNGFLWNMVRIIAGTLVEAGKGKCGPERVREALRTGDRRLAGPTLPPHGLCLEWIRYRDAGRP